MRPAHWKRSSDRPVYYNQPSYQYQMMPQHHYLHQPHQNPQHHQQHQQPLPPFVSPKHESVPSDCFHACQQFQGVINATHIQRINAYNHMRNFYLHKEPGLNISEIELPNLVDFTLNIHGNEYRHLMLQLPYFGNKILERMPTIHSKNGCQISLTDRSGTNDADFTKIKLSGRVEVVDDALSEFLTLLPVHIGMHLSGLKADLKSTDLRTTLCNWMEQGVYDFTTISFHFVKDGKSKDKELYKYVVLREARDKSSYLIDAAYAFSNLALNKPLTEEFSAGYRLPSVDRIWFTGVPEGDLVKAICEASNTTIKYSNKNSLGNTMDFSIFGNPKALILADELLRKVSQVSLRFDVDDEDLKEPHYCHPGITNELIESNLVLISYNQSLYQNMPETGTARIRHSILLKTSYENRHMLYRTRRELLRPHLTRDLPLNEVETKPEPLLFAQHLRRILVSLASSGEEQQHQHQVNHKSFHNSRIY